MKKRMGIMMMVICMILGFTINDVYAYASESKINEIDYNIPDRVVKCGRGGTNCSLGKYLKDNNNFCYAIFSGGIERFSIELNVNLQFGYSEGIAVGDDGNLYYLVFSNDPYEIQIIKIETPEEMLISTIYEDYTSNIGTGFFSMQGVSGKRYFLVPSSVAIIARNQLPENNMISQIEVDSNDFQILEIKPENFDTYQIIYGNDAGFKLECTYYMKGGYSYRYIADIPNLKRQYLSCIIPAEELDRFLQKEIHSYDEVCEIISELNTFLADWEQNNEMLIRKKYMSCPGIFAIRDKSWGAREFLDYLRNK